MSSPDRILTNLAEALEAISERIRDEVLWNGSIWEDNSPEALIGQGCSLIAAAHAELLEHERLLITAGYLAELDRKGI